MNCGSMSRFPLAAAIAALLACVQPVFAASCSFKAHGLSLSFGVLDPSNASNITRATIAATAGADQVGHCNNVAMTISGDNGLNYNGSRRLSNGASYISYTLNLPINLAAPGNSYTTFSFTGTILGTAYLNAPAGNYSDTVIITVSP